MNSACWQKCDASAPDLNFNEFVGNFCTIFDPQTLRNELRDPPEKNHQNLVPIFYFSLDFGIPWGNFFSSRKVPSPPPENLDNDARPLVGRGWPFFATRIMLQILTLEKMIGTVF